MTRRKKKPWREKYARHIRYERTPKGFLCRAYTKMRIRVAYRKPSYEDVPLCSRQEFYDWFLDDLTFRVLWARWVKSGCRKNDRPTPDRINPVLGYVRENIRWRTYLENVTDSSGFKQRNGTLEPIEETCPF